MKDKNIKCLYPWTSLKIFSDSTFNCCMAEAGTLASPVPSIVELPFDHPEGPLYQIWNSERIMLCRMQMVEGGCPLACGYHDLFDFHYSSCYSNIIDINKFKHLPFLSTKQEENMIKAKNNFENGIIFIDNLPIEIEIRLGMGCNMNCETCCQKFYQKHNLTKEVPIEKLKCDLVIFLENAQKIIVCGGEPTFCKNYNTLMDIIQNINAAKAHVITNGQLIKEKIIPYTEIINWLSISVDAATEKTYHKVRHGGNWGKMMRDIDKINSFSNKPHLTLTFLISVFNYKEMPKMVKMAYNLGANHITFNEVGFLSDEEKKKYVDFPFDFNDVFEEMKREALTHKLYTDYVFGGQNLFGTILPQNA